MESEMLSRSKGRDGLEKVNFKAVFFVPEVSIIKVIEAGIKED